MRALAIGLANSVHDSTQPLAVAQLSRDLPRLTLDERAVFDSLRDNRLRARVRLEQERIGFGWLLQALAALPDAAPAVVADAKGSN